MEWYWALIILIGTAFALMLTSLPVAVAFFGTNLLGALFYLGGSTGLLHVARNMVEAVSKYSLVPIVMFLLMGELLVRSGLARRAIDAIDHMMSEVPGRLSLVAVSGGTVFAMLSGSSMASTAVLGSTLIPEMRQRAYRDSMAIGPILAAGPIAMLIPPSALAVLLGSLAGVSIANLLIAGIVPGLMLAAAAGLYVILRCWLQPELAPHYEMVRRPLAQRLRPLITQVLPLLSLVVVVIGSILDGWATPTESAALGAVAAALLCGVYRRLSWGMLFTALKETAELSVMILFIVAASLTFSQILGFTGSTSGLVRFVGGAELAPLILICAMLAVVLMLGCFMEPLSIMIVTIPFFMPLLAQTGIDPIWFCVMMLVALEIGQITPPFGLSLFVVKSVAPTDVTMKSIFLAAVPYIVIGLAVLAALLAFPGLSNWYYA